MSAPTMRQLIAAVEIVQVLRDRYGDDLTVDQLAGLTEREKRSLLRAVRILRPTEDTERLERAMGRGRTEET